MTIKVYMMMYHLIFDMFASLIEDLSENQILKQIEFYELLVKNDLFLI